MEELYKICEDCKNAIWFSEDPGYSSKECGMSSRCIRYIEGCDKDTEPYYDEEEEAITCDEYKRDDRYF